MSKNLPPLEYLPDAVRPPPLETKPSQVRTHQGKYITEGDLTQEIDFYAENQRKQDNIQKMKRAIKSNPFVPVGCLVTLGVLARGLFAMKNKDTAKSQAMMRYRVAAQGVTIMALIAGTFVTQLIYKPEDD